MAHYGTGRRGGEDKWARAILVAANAVAALATAGFGLVLAATGRYAAEAVTAHRWVGVVCAGFAVIAFFAQRWGEIAFRFALVGLGIATAAAGHLGATLTHGEAVTNLFPSWNAPERTALRDGNAAVEAILTQHCYECHGPSTSKGRLRLDTDEGRAKGGKSGKPAIVQGNLGQSEVVRRITLARTDEQAMPPDDRPGLTAAEIAEIERWILGQ